MNPLFKLFSIEKSFNRFDGDVKTKEWNKACNLLIKNLGLNVTIDLKNFPIRGAVLVYSNHPTGLDPFIIGSVLKRDDYKFLGDSYHLKKGPNIAKHIAPTAVIGFWRELITRRPTNWPGFINMRLIAPVTSKENAKQLNNKAINELIYHIKNKGVGVVFPSGGAYEFLPWKSGLTKIIRQLDKKRTNFTLYRIKIKYLSEFKLLMHFVLGGKFFSDLKIEGYPVGNYDSQSDKLTSILKSK